MATRAAPPLLQLHTAAGADMLKILDLSASEEVGRLFEFNVTAVSADKDLDLAKLLGTHATVDLELPDGKRRHFDGIVAAAGLDGAHGRHVRYRLVLRPWLWLLTRRADTRIFQDMSVIDILKKVVQPYTPVLAERQTGTYQPIPYCVQYRETDFNFVSRLIEHEGLSYYFEHEKNRHTMVLLDALATHPPFGSFATIGFREHDVHATGDETISDWRTQFEAQPGKAVLNDYNFEEPATKLLASESSTIKDAKPAWDYYDPPGGYGKMAEGARYARLRMEELESRYVRVAGSGNCRGIATGHKFTLDQHPASKQNAAHVVLSTRIDAGGGDHESSDRPFHFHCSFTALPLSLGVYRLPRITPKPTVPGPQTATVVGKSGEEIFADKYGRVKVQFHWDRLGKMDEKSSCWVRVAYPTAGKGFGMIALPRIGHEVVVEFLEGDPDRPLITGSVYHATNKVPYPLPDNMTVSTLKTHSSKNGADTNFNELRFEDKKGSEYIWFQAEKDYYQLVKHDAWQVVGNDQFRLVKRHLQEEIKENVQRIVGKNQQEQIKGDQSLDITGKSANKVGGAYGLKVTGDLVLESGAAVSVKSGADMVQKVGANLGVDAAANVHIKGGANVVIEAGAMLTLKCGGGSVVIGPANVAITGTMVQINSGGGGGSGAGASPKTPEATQAPKAPEEPKDPLAPKS